MAEVITPVEGEGKVTTSTGSELPGGFESADAMYVALEKAKADLAENKTRKTNLTVAETELQKYKDAEAARLDEERTELEKVQAKIAEFETTIAEKDALISKAQMNTLFERELSGRLARLDEPSAKLMRMHYSAAVNVSEGYADAETLKSILDPVDELLKGVKSDNGTKVIMTSSTPPAGEPAKFSDKIKEILGMNQGELMKLAKEGK